MQEVGKDLSNQVFYKLDLVKEKVSKLMSDNAALKVQLEALANAIPPNAVPNTKEELKEEKYACAAALKDELTKIIEDMEISIRNLKVLEEVI